MELKKMLVNTISEINSSISKMLSQQDYLNSRVDKHKIYIDKVYTSNEWLTVEKRKMVKQLEYFNENSVTK